MIFKPHLVVRIIDHLLHKGNRCAPLYLISEKYSSVWLHGLFFNQYALDGVSSFSLNKLVEKKLLFSRSVHFNLCVCVLSRFSHVRLFVVL